MAEGWHLIKHSSSAKDKRSTYVNNQVDHLYRSSELDIGRYYFHKNAILYIDPLQSGTEFKTYILLSGRCMELETRNELTTGDLLVLQNTPGMISLYFSEDSVVLIHSSQTKSIDQFKQHADDMIQMLADLQHKDNYTKEHSDRVFDLCKLMGLELGLHSKRIFNLNRAARFHDIGKVFIKDTVLNKPGPLNAGEFALLQQHVQLGKDLILATYDEEVYEIILQHHERLGGQGYPRGLHADQILPEAKIIAICDSFDAMTTNRVYKTGKSTDEAFAELRTMSDTHYDAEMVELFIKLYSAKK
ncbi:MAG: HD-GYP domain-containing protein [Spirochaetes bacterium]|nr:HD-GYP domain-containing protein [Spirochaetota bacterium]